MTRLAAPRALLTLTSLRTARAGAPAISADRDVLLDEISEWVNEGGAGGEVRRQAAAQMDAQPNGQTHVRK